MNPSAADLLDAIEKINADKAAASGVKSNAAAPAEDAQ